MPKAASKKSKPETSEALTDKQARFVEEYLLDLNGTQAAIRAGYSEKTARQIATENLSKPSVHDAIAKAMAERSNRTLVTADQVVRELARIGFSDMRTFADFGPDGVTLKELSELSEDAARCVAEVSQSTTTGGGSIRFKLHDKKGALDSLGKHLGLFVEKHEHSGPNGGPIPIERIERVIVDPANPNGTGIPAVAGSQPV